MRRSDVLGLDLQKGDFALSADRTAITAPGSKEKLCGVSLSNDVIQLSFDWSSRINGKQVQALLRCATYACTLKGGSGTTSSAKAVVVQLSCLGETFTLPVQVAIVWKCRPKPVVLSSAHTSIEVIRDGPCTPDCARRSSICGPGRRFRKGQPISGQPQRRKRDE